MGVFGKRIKVLMAEFFEFVLKRGA